MRLRPIALSCALTGTLGFLALPAAPALAENTVLTGSTVQAVPAKATLTLHGPATVVYGANVVISGRLALATGRPPARTPITVTRAAPGRTTKTFTAHTGTAGDFAFTDHDPAKARYTYTAAFAGDSSATPATASVHVTVETVK